MPANYRIDPDISRAESLPGAFYRSQATYDSLLERAFGPSWQWIGHAGELASGEARPASLLAGSLDEQLLLARDQEHELRCLSNVCTHRGNLLVQAQAACSRLRCRYHGRTFGLDGRFRSMPDFEQAQDFPRPADDLPQLPLESIAGALFTALRPSLAFDEWTAQVRPLLDTLPLSEFVYAPELARVFDVRSHWALYVDNFLEGFHIPYVHPELAKQLDESAYHYELARWSNLQIGYARAGATAFEPAQTLAPAAERVAAYYYWLFPSTMLNFYPWGLSLNVVEPLGLERTRVTFHSYVWRPELLQSGAGAGLEVVQRQDEEVVESVQRGLRSSLYTRGRFSPTREQGVHHFQRLLATTLG